MSKNLTIPFFLAAVIAVIVGAATNLKPLELGADLTARLGAIASGLIAAALLVERAVEVLLGVPRAKEAETLKDKVVAHESATKAADLANDATQSSASRQAAVTARNSLTDHREQTKRQAVALSFLLGAVLSGFGVRALAQFWKFSENPHPALVGVDIFFTACLLSAGGQGVHLLFSTLGNYLNSLRSENR